MRFLLALCAFAAAAPAQDIIAKTEALSPQDERKSFKVPAGFEVQLVAAEPDIGKPIQIAFDSAGRLWATTSRHYPFPAGKGKASDKLYILSDFDANGKAKKVEVFCDSLNIPIGILPLPDRKSCLVSEVGRILKLTDTKGTGKADKIEELFTGFGTEDTHGMTNSFLYMPDGWVYATHGFKNISKVKATDGSEIEMNSGNTYRFKPDGSRIEIVTRGQVNPFGLCCDPFLNLYTADCHSKPITQLIRGATYQSFSKPHDGLGFAPHVTNHSHGSTALCGLEWYSDTVFPKEYRDCMFLGNVVTNRINADRMTFKGSTPVAEELPDFLTSSDPWFRPTDIKLGMDGALYFADFYNRIIGHYEVKLDHPQRDKDRGRIWRIVYKGKSEPEVPAKAIGDLRKLPPTELSTVLTGSNLTTKLLAFHEAVLRARTNKMGEVAPELCPEEAFTIYTLSFVKDDVAKSYEQMLKTNGMPMRQFAAKPEWTEEERAKTIKGFEEYAKAPWTLRALVDGVTQHPHLDFVPALLKFIPTIPAEDTHLKFAARVALRDCLRNEEYWKTLESNEFAKEPLFIEMATAVPNATTAHLLAGMYWSTDFPAGLRLQAAEVIGGYGSMWDWCDVCRQKPEPTNESRLKVHAATQALLRSIHARSRSAEPTGSGSGGSSFLTNIATYVLQDDQTTHGDEVAREYLRTGRLYLQLKGHPPLLTKRDPLQFAAIRCLLSKDFSAATHAEAAEMFTTEPTKQVRDELLKAVQDSTIAAEVRSKLAMPLLRGATTGDIVAAKNLVKEAPYSMGLPLAVGMASDPFGADLLLLAVKNGEAPARLLQEKAVLDKLKATGVRDLDQTVKDLTAGLPSPEKRIDDLIKKRVGAFPKAKADAALGKAVFAKHCAVCHTIGNEGAKVGPQLDGVGIRGADRLIEDTLDPSRNVDAAFRATTFDMADGRTVSGLLAREEGAVYVVFDAQGKEQRLAKDDVLKKKTSVLSAMPANVDALVPEKDYYDLLAYLLEQKPK